MTSDESNIHNIKIHIKQYLNELHYADKLSKKFTNSEKEKPIWLVQYNNVNLLYGLLLDILRNGNPSNFWNGNREKGI